jgi:hypothetical protein
MKYLFKQIDNISGSNAVTTVEFEVDSLPDILEHFELFLKGAGYMMEGKIDIIPDEEYYGYDETGDDEPQPLWGANDGYADLAKVWINSAGTEAVGYPLPEDMMPVQEHSIHYFDTTRNK